MLHVAPGIVLLEDGQIPGPERNVRLFQMSDPRGCLMCNRAAGLAGTDPDVASWIQGRLGRLRSAFAVALDGDHNTELPMVETADRLMRQYIGIRIGQRVAGGNAGHPATA